jgi:TonB family protein
MDHDDQKAADSKEKSGNYEEAILAFVDNETKASTRGTNAPQMQRADADLRVDGLLKEPIAASDPMEVGKDPGLDELDRLFASIFNERKEVVQAATESTLPDSDSRTRPAEEEISRAVEGSVNFSAVENAPGQEVVDMTQVKLSPPHEEVLAETVQNLPPPAFVQETPQNQPNPDCAMTESPRTWEPITVFSLPARKPIWNVQTAAVAIAFLCLLAGSGIVHFAGPGSTTPATRPAVERPPLPRSTTSPSVISRVLPAYPEIARRLNITGTVVVQVLIDEQGKVVKATPVSGPRLLYPEAVSAILRWRFKPANLDGINVPGSSQVSIVFD